MPIPKWYLTWNFYTAISELWLPGSVQFSCSVMSDSLQPHESQHARPPCPSPTPGVHSDSRGKTISLTRRTFVGKVMFLLFNMLSRLVITFLPNVSEYYFSCNYHGCHFHLSYSVWHIQVFLYILNLQNWCFSQPLEGYKLKLMVSM